MKKFYIRYHLIGNRVIVEEDEFESFADAVEIINEELKNKTIFFSRNDGHYIEIKTEYITYFEIMNEKEYKKAQDLNYISNLARMALE